MTWCRRDKNPGSAQTSAPPAALAKPAINNEFWFQQSKTMVQNAINLRDTASDKLQEGVKWLWTAYTAVALVGTTVLAEKLGWWAALPLLAILVPALLLPIAFFAAGEVRIPTWEGFHPDAPKEIEAAYYRIADLKESRMQRAKWWTYGSVAFVVLAIIVSTVAGMIAAGTKEQTANTFNVALDGTGDTTKLLVGGAWPAGTKVEFTVVTNDGGKQTATATSTLLSPPDGELNTSFDVAEAESYTVTGTWKEEKVGTHSLEKAVDGAKKPKGNSTGAE